MPNQFDQLLASLTKKPNLGFDPDYLGDEMVDPSVRSDAFSGSMQGELRDRLFQAERTQAPVGASPATATSPHEVAALQRLLGSYGQERAASPIAQQQQTYDAQNAGNLAAMNAGFSSGPGQSAMQAREIERRNLEKEKLRQPVALQQSRQDHATAIRDKELTHNREIANLQYGPANMDAQSRQQWQDAVLSGNQSATNMERFRGMNRYGPQFTPENRPNLNPLMRDLAADQFSARENPLTATEETPESRSYWQNARSIISQRLGKANDPTLADDFVWWLQDPAALSFDEQWVPENPTPADMQDLAALRELAVLFGKQ